MSKPSDAQYTLSEVAKLLAVNPSTVRWWVNEGRLEAQKKGRSWVVDREIIDDMVTSGTRPVRHERPETEPEPLLDLGPANPRRPDRRVSRAIEQN